jgi:deoxycytidylate deaminase
MLAEVIDKLQQAGWFSTSRANQPAEKLVEETHDRAMRGTRSLNVLEYGRIVHAEMAAIIEAAGRGVSAQGCTLYTTTYPCHDYPRHMVAVGVTRVIYQRSRDARDGRRVVSEPRKGFVYLE